jgi:hypothetical protein
MGSGQSTKGKTEPPPLQRQRPQLQKQCAKCAMTCGMHTETCTRCGCRQFQSAPMVQPSSRQSLSLSSLHGCDERDISFTELSPVQRQRPKLQKQCAKCARTCGMHTHTCTRCGCRQFQAAPMDQMSSRPSSARLLPSSSPQMSGPASKDTERRPAKLTPAKQALTPLRQFSELTPPRLANNAVAPAPSEWASQPRIAVT